MGEIDVAHIKKAVEVLEEALEHFKRRVEIGDIDGIIVNYCYDVKLLKDNDYLIKIYRTGSLSDSFNLMIQKEGNIICNIDINVFGKDFIDYLLKELYYIHGRVLEILRDELKRRLDLENREGVVDMDLVKCYIIRENGLKEVKVEFVKDCYNVENIREIINKLDGISGDILKLEGRAPIWLYCSLTAYLKNLFKKIYTYDPKLNGYVCVYSLDNLGLGKIEKEE